MNPGAFRYVERYGCSRDKLRAALHRKQRGLCGICGQKFGKKFLASRHVNLDHKHSRAHGGPDVVENLQLTHSHCNSKKGSTCSPGVPCLICYPEQEWPPPRSLGGRK